jgi:cation transport protein ChaC
MALFLCLFELIGRRMSQGQDLFLFGYGSLTWRPGEVEFVSANPRAHVRGFKRRFWQRSEDHRGVPGSAGRVCVCVEWTVARESDPNQPATEAEAVVHGCLFQIAAAHRDKTLAYLDVREKGGYQSICVPVFSSESGDLLCESAVVFSADALNEFWCADSPLEDIARIIHSSVGPSGSNLEYFERLAQWLRDHDAHDAHIADLERHVAQLKA